jgi:cation transport ATPase
MLVDGRVGSRILKEGATHEIRIGYDSGLITQDAHGRYQEAVMRGNVFIAAPPASLTWAAGLTTTATVAAICNPPTSGKNLVMLATGFALTATTASVIGLSVQTYSAAVSVVTTSFLINNALMGSGNAPVARTTLTLQSTPIVAMILGGMSGASAITVNTSFVELGGVICIGPGCAIAVESSAAQTGWAYMAWEEVPLP